MKALERRVATHNVPRRARSNPLREREKGKKWVQPTPVRTGEERAQKRTHLSTTLTERKTALCNTILSAGCQVVGFLFRTMSPSHSPVGHLLSKRNVVAKPNVRNLRALSGLLFASNSDGAPTTLVTPWTPPPTLVSRDRVVKDVTDPRAAGGRACACAWMYA